MTYRIAVDIGGTFTDGVIEAVETGRIRVAKRLSTAADPGEAVSQVIGDLLATVEADRDGDGAAATDVQDVVHGSTLVSNALIERKGAPTALVVTTGTRDVIDIAREVRYDLYDLHIELPKPLVPVDLRFELDERTSADGTILEAPDPRAIEAVVEAVRAAGVTSVAVSFLHSYVNAGNEAALGEALRRMAPELAVSLSSRVAREIREYERTTTATANAFVQPSAARYLRQLDERLRRAGISGMLRIMASSGGFTSAETAAEVPITILESGPAGGVLSAANAGRAAGFDDVLAFDMGGTTAKACAVVGGAPAVIHAFEAARVRRFKRGSGLPLLVPSIDLIEIGAGGGSIASINALGLLAVGPASAGADPGPACYGRGGEAPTVTDADLVLGYLNPDYFLGGRLSLDEPAARHALAGLGARLGGDALDAARGIYMVVNEAMASAARVHIAEKGWDPRRFTLVATGGAGPVHGVEVARRLNIRRVLFPLAAGAGSCLGFLAAPARVDRSWSKPMQLAAMDWAAIDAALARMYREAAAEIATTGVDAADVDWRIHVEMRYAGQGASLTVSFAYRDVDAAFAPELERLFKARYADAYGGILPAGTPEAVTWRVAGVSSQEVRHFTWPTRPAGSAEAALKTRRRVLCPGPDALAEVPVYARYELPPGARLRGPLILEEEESTIVVPVEADVEVLENLSVVARLEA